MPTLKKYTQERAWRFVALFVALFLTFFHLSVADADPIMIFEDDFDQSDSSGLTNMWDNDMSDSSNASRMEESNDDLLVGVEGRGLFLEGGNSADPDDSADRSIATKGYETIYIQYSRALGNAGDGSGTWYALYSLDNGATFTELESLAVEDMVHTLSPVFTVSNSDRKTKLILRFYINATNKNVEAGIDNVKITGETPPLFYDGFESHGFSYGEWTVENNPVIVHDDESGKKIWTDDNDFLTADPDHVSPSGDDRENGHGVTFYGYDDSNPDDAIEKSFDTEEFENLKLRYARRVKGLDKDESFESMYSIDGGDTWIDLETVTGVSGNSDDSPYTSVFYTLEDVDQNSDLKIRFEISANNGSDKAFVDDVVIWGDSASDDGEDEDNEEDEEENDDDGDEDNEDESDDGEDGGDENGAVNITGYKWNDQNANGNWQEVDEPGIENWTIAIGRKSAPREDIIPIEIVALSLTGSNGGFSLPVTESGGYRIFEVSRDGWKMTHPDPITGNFQINCSLPGCDGLSPFATSSFFDVFVEPSELGGSDITTDESNQPIHFGNTQDTESDGVPDFTDNCLEEANKDQANNDEDDAGDACDSDDDNDEVPDTDDDFPLDQNETTDTDEDGTGDNTDTDDDSDGQSDADETKCGSDPLDNKSVSPDKDNDNIPDCVDETNGNGNGNGDNDGGGNSGGENHSSSGGEIPVIFGGANMNGAPSIGQTFTGQVLGAETSTEEQIEAIKKKIVELKKLLESMIEKHIIELMRQLINALESEITRLLG